MAFSDAPILAFDTSAAHCAAALLCGDEITARVEHMGRGQAERLVPFIQDLLDARGVRLSHLSRIGVGIGPGNFTGIRISISLARGLAAGLGVPTIGISGFAALRHAGGAATVAIPGPRDTAYLQDATGRPVIVPKAEVPAGAVWAEDTEEMVKSMACLAGAAATDGPPPAPLYMRPADAAPARDRPPRILDDA